MGKKSSKIKRPVSCDNTPARTTVKKLQYELMCTSCARNNENVSACIYCKSCQDHLCVRCLQWHTKYRGDHVDDLIGQDEMRKFGVQGPPMVQTGRCLDHENQIWNEFNQNGSIAGCQMCMNEKHRTYVSVIPRSNLHIKAATPQLSKTNHTDVIKLSPNDGQVSGKLRHTIAVDGQISGELRLNIANKGQVSGKRRQNVADDGQVSGELRGNIANKGQVSGKRRENVADDGRVSGELWPNIVNNGQVSCKRRANVADDGPISGKLRQNVVDDGQVDGRKHEAPHTFEAIQVNGESKIAVQRQYSDQLDGSKIISERSLQMNTPYTDDGDEPGSSSTESEKQTHL